MTTLYRTISQARQNIQSGKWFLCGATPTTYFVSLFSLFFFCRKLHLPYFNLADGARSTDASLLVEVVVLKRASEHGDYVARSSDSSSDERQMTEICQHGHREEVSQPDAPPKALAAARLDVQTALIAGFSRSGAMSTASSTGENVAFKVATTGAGTTFRSCPKLPGSISVSLKLSFSERVFNDATVGEQPVGSTIQRTGHENDVPAFFAVATTLFDCTKTMNEAELRLFIRCGNTGAVSKLSSGGRGEIGKPSLVVAGQTSPRHAFFGEKNHNSGPNRCCTM